MNLDADIAVEKAPQCDREMADMIGARVVWLADYLWAGTKETC